MFKKILIANRGEIAVRIAHTCRQMGIKAVAVYSEPDRNALHVASADEAYALPGATASDTYLQADRLIAIARSCGADGVHPGYGFLSENADFAQACEHAGLRFIGPPPGVIRALGDKPAAKQALDKLGVPVVPSWSKDGQALVQAPPPHIEADPGALGAAGENLEFPLLVKAAAGGGGRGMRLVHSAQQLSAAVQAARHEAAAAFGDDRVFLEKYLSRPRHVEIQILADQHGQVVHLFERECSIQRRHQKIVEESPAPLLAPAVRADMAEAAVRAARAVGYVNAGTFEFMVDESGHFYFLEANTRLQVEHPVTEMVTKRDLIGAQILIAAGEPLPFAQNDVTVSGHAIEARIYAEDPRRDFSPSIGTLERFIPPSGPDIRVDSGVTRGVQITTHYDAMLAKLIVWGRTRQDALKRLSWSLDEFVVLGAATNIAFLRRLVADPQFQQGRVHTQFLAENPIIVPDRPPPQEAWVAAALAARSPGTGRQQPAAHSGTDRPDPWCGPRPWRIC